MNECTAVYPSSPCKAMSYGLHMLFAMTQVPVDLLLYMQASFNGLLKQSLQGVDHSLF